MFCRNRITLALLTAFTLVCGCSPTIETADQVTLYSLDGFSSGEVDYVDHPPPEGTLHGYGVLGHTVLNQNDRRRIAEALNHGIAEANSVDACFMPRHGLRLKRGGRQLDYVICFQCGQLFEVEGSSGRDFTMVSDSPEPLFDAILKEAGIVLAPKFGTDDYERWYNEMTGE